MSKVYSLHVCDAPTHACDPPYILTCPHRMPAMCPLHACTAQYTPDRGPDRGPSTYICLWSQCAALSTYLWRPPVHTCDATLTRLWCPQHMHVVSSQ